MFIVLMAEEHGRCEARVQDGVYIHEIMTYKNILIDNKMYRKNVEIKKLTSLNIFQYS